MSFTRDYEINLGEEPLRSWCGDCPNASLGKVRIESNGSMAEGEPNAWPAEKLDIAPLLTVTTARMGSAGNFCFEANQSDESHGNSKRYLALHKALLNFDVEAISRLLVSKGANPNEVDEDGNSLLHVLMSTFDRDPVNATSIAKLLLGKGCDCNLLNNDKWAPIHLAARRSQISAISFIVARNLEASNECLLGRCVHSSERALSPKGRKTNGRGQETQGLLVPSDPSHGTTNDPKESFVITRRCPGVFDFNIFGGTHQWTALHLAGHISHIKIIKLLIQGGADVTVPNRNGRKPKHVAKGNLAIVKVLKDAEDEWFLLKTQPSLKNFILKSGFEKSRSKLQELEIKSSIPQHSLSFTYPNASDLTNGSRPQRRKRNLAPSASKGLRIVFSEKDASGSRRLISYIDEETGLPNIDGSSSCSSEGELSFLEPKISEELAVADRLAGISLERRDSHPASSSIDGGSGESRSSLLLLESLRHSTGQSVLQFSVEPSWEESSQKRETGFGESFVSKLSPARLFHLRRTILKCIQSGFRQEELQRLKRQFSLPSSDLKSSLEEIQRVILKIRNGQSSDESIIKSFLYKSFPMKLANRNLTQSHSLKDENATARSSKSRASRDLGLSFWLDSFKLALLANYEDLIRIVIMNLSSIARKVAELRNTEQETLVHILCRSKFETRWIGRELVPETLHGSKADLLVFLLQQLGSGDWDLNAKDIRGLTPLHLACEWGDLDLVRLLLLNASFPNLREYSTGWTPLHFAVSNGHHNVITQMLYHPVIDCDLEDNFSVSPLDIAVSRCDLKASALLVNRGATFPVYHANKLFHLVPETYKAQLYVRDSNPGGTEQGCPVKKDEYREWVATIFHHNNLKPHNEEGSDRVSPENPQASRFMLRAMQSSSSNERDAKYELRAELGSIGASSPALRGGLNSPGRVRKFFIPSSLVKSCSTCLEALGVGKIRDCALCSSVLCSKCVVDLEFDGFLLHEIKASSSDIRIPVPPEPASPPETAQKDKSNRETDLRKIGISPFFCCCTVSVKELGGPGGGVKGTPRFQCSTVTIFPAASLMKPSPSVSEKCYALREEHVMLSKQDEIALQETGTQQRIRLPPPDTSKALPGKNSLVLSPDAAETRRTAVRFHTCKQDWHKLFWSSKCPTASSCVSKQGVGNPRRLIFCKSCADFFLGL